MLLNKLWLCYRWPTASLHCYIVASGQFIPQTEYKIDSPVHTGGGTHTGWATLYLFWCSWLTRSVDKIIYFNRNSNGIALAVLVSSNGTAPHYGLWSEDMVFLLRPHYTGLAPSCRRSMTKQVLCRFNILTLSILFELYGSPGAGRPLFPSSCKSSSSSMSPFPTARRIVLPSRRLVDQKEGRNEPKQQQLFCCCCNFHKHVPWINTQWSRYHWNCWSLNDFHCWVGII